MSGLVGAALFGGRKIKFCKNSEQIIFRKRFLWAKSIIGREDKA